MKRKPLKRVFSVVCAAVLVLSIPAGAYAEMYYLEQGSVEVTANESGQYVTQADAGYFDVAQTTETVITQTDGQPTDNTVTITAEGGATAEVTLDNVNIDASSTPKRDAKAAVSTNADDDSNVVIELDGDNVLKGGEGRAALETTSGSVTIQDETGEAGSLDATGGAYAAGIGGRFLGDGDVTINGGTIDARGGSNAAGIGGGVGDWIYWTEGNVVTNSEIARHHQIGPFPYDSGDGHGVGKVTINGGKVTATGGNRAQAIGGGCGGEAEISITGGEVTAKRAPLGGEFSSSAWFEGGIGGGWMKDGTVSISGGKVYSEGVIGNNVDISGGEVDARGSIGGPGAYYENPKCEGEYQGRCNVVIRGGKVTARMSGNAAIGAGWDNTRHIDKENIIICEDAEVKVTHGAYYNGIGGSDEANVNTDCLFTTGSIDGVHGTVTAHDYGDWTQCGDGTEHRSCARCGLEQVRGQQDVKPGGEDKDGGQSEKAAHPAADEDAFLTLYTVTDLDGKDIEFTIAEADGALTITVDDSAAVLSVYMPKLLMQYGVQSMTLVTDKQETTVALADYEDYAPPIVLTHDGAARTLTAGGEALDLN